jgi:hypothetical protein
MARTRRRCGPFRGHQARLRNRGVPTAALRINIFARARCGSGSVTPSLPARITVRRSSQPRVDVEKDSVRTDRCAFPRRRRSELVIFNIAFTGSGECATHPASHATSPDAMRTSVRQYPLPFSSSPIHAHLRHSCLTSQWHTGASRPRGEAATRLAGPHRVALRSPTRFYRLSRSVRRSRCVGVCGPRTHPCESRPVLARSQLAHSRGRWRLPPPLRPRLPCVQPMPPSSRQEP